MVFEMVKQLLYEGGQLSLTRTITVVAFVAFLVASAYLILAGQSWQHYETFATFTAGSGTAMQATNKLINSKYNSPTGEPYSK